jgi:hypothetical protein
MKRYGEVPTVGGVFSITPSWMTVSGCAFGNKVGQPEDNLLPAMQESFVAYLSTVLKHFRDVEGVRFESREPFNEPGSGRANSAAAFPRRVTRPTCGGVVHGGFERDDVRSHGGEPQPKKQFYALAQYLVAWRRGRPLAGRGT